jgi:hypothetical protein
MRWLYLFTSSNKAVLHTVRAKCDNIKANYISINSMIMGCMERNWMTQTEQQMEKITFGNLFGYKYNALNKFQGLKKEIPYVVTVEFRASIGYNVGSSFITHSAYNWLVLISRLQNNFLEYYKKWLKMAAVQHKWYRFV